LLNNYLVEGFVDMFMVSCLFGLILHGGACRIIKLGPEKRKKKRLKRAKKGRRRRRKRPNLAQLCLPIIFHQPSTKLLSTIGGAMALV
jgi:hypothetical protein